MLKNNEILSITKNHDYSPQEVESKRSNYPHDPERSTK